jgi:hypothetical protein
MDAPRIAQEIGVRSNSDGEARCVASLSSSRASLANEPASLIAPLALRMTRRGASRIHLNGVSYGSGPGLREWLQLGDTGAECAVRVGGGLITRVRGGGTEVRGAGRRADFHRCFPMSSDAFLHSIHVRPSFLHQHKLFLSDGPSVRPPPPPPRRRRRRRALAGRARQVPMQAPGTQAGHARTATRRRVEPASTTLKRDKAAVAREHHGSLSL